MLAQTTLRLDLRPSLLLPRNPDDWHRRFALGAEPPLVLAGESAVSAADAAAVARAERDEAAAAAAEAVAADGDGDGEVTEAERRAALAARAVVVEVWGPALSLSLSRG